MSATQARSKLPTLAGLLAAGLLVVGAATGCGSPTSSGTSEASTTPSTSASPTAEAWTRGTFATITNNSDQTVETITGTFVNSYPQGQASPLSPGMSTTVKDPWGYSGSSVAMRATFSDGKSVDIRLVNPAIGTPEVEYRSALNIDWENAPSDSKTLDENQALTFTVDGHSFTASRLGDDGENKNWALTINS